MGYAEKNLAPGEQIVYRTRYHWIIYRAALVLFALALLLGAAALYASRTAPSEGVGRFVGLASLAFAALAALAYLGRRIRAAADEFVVTNRRVVRRVGLLSREIQQASLDRIQDITVEQGIMGRMLGYGDVTLETASETGQLLFAGIADPEAFRNHLWGQGLASSTPPAPGTSGVTVGPAGSRLENLEEMMRRGLVTAEEYQAKRKEILSGL